MDGVPKTARGEGKKRVGNSHSGRETEEKFGARGISWEMSEDRGSASPRLPTQTNSEKIALLLLLPLSLSVAFNVEFLTFSRALFPACSKSKGLTTPFSIRLIKESLLSSSEQLFWRPYTLENATKRR